MHHEKNAEFIASTLDDMMQKIEVKNVVQIYTDNAANYERAGINLMQKFTHLYSAGHCPSFLSIKTLFLQKNVISNYSG